MRRTRTKAVAAVMTAALAITACTSDGSDDGDDETVETDEGDEEVDEEPAEEEEADEEPADEEEAEEEPAEEDDGEEEPAEEDDGEEEPAEEDDGEEEMASGDVGAVGGSGCGIPHGAYDDPGEASGEVRVAWNDPLLSFNNATTHANATANANPLYLMHSGFNYYDGDLNLVNNDSFGTCVIESLDPLTVTYRINEGVTWSDGVQIDAADMILNWGATSGHFNEGNSTFLSDGSAIQVDEDGNWLVTDGSEVRAETAEDYTEDGELVEGLEYVPAEGVAFDGSSESYELVLPENVSISDDGLAVTFEWDSFYVDYQLSAPGINPPAHVVAKRALGIEDPTEAKQALIDAFMNADGESLAPIATSWSSDFDTDELPAEEELYLSSGPYLVTAYEQRAQMTFEANPNYNWGPKPKVQTIVYRIIGDPTAAVQAMANEEIDVIQPQATADILTQLEGLADRGIVPVPNDTAVYEHVDLVFDNGGPFDPATYGGDEEVAKMVRQALLMTVPRQEIVDRLIVPLNPNATTRDSFTQAVTAPTYENIASNNGVRDMYAEVDIEGAIALLEEAGVSTPIDVRTHFAANNPRRANEYELMAASAAQAGFNLIDGNSPSWGSQLSDNSIYDMTFFGWQSTAVAVADTEANFVSTGQNNFGHYSSEVVDALYDELKATTDPDRQQEILLEVEQNLTEDAFGVPLFQFPGLAAYNSTYVSGIEPISISPTIFWNVWDWEAA